MVLVRALLALALPLAAGCGAPLLYEGRADLAVEPLEVRLLRITADRLEPAGPIRLRAGEGGLAFLNDTRDRVVAVVLPAHALPGLRCTYTQGFEADGEATFTARPLAPGGSASLCFHAAGTFPVEVHGVGDAPVRTVVEVVPSVSRRASRASDRAAAPSGTSATAISSGEVASEARDGGTHR